MKNKPLVSVIIPTYNRAGKLPVAINSLLNQTYLNVQPIIVDDGSEDNTAELIKKYPQIEYVLQEHAGQAAARNNGLRHAKGTIIASLDSDDEWYPDFLTRCVEKIEKDNLDFVFANWHQETREGTTWDFLAGDPFINPYFHKMKNGWVDLNNEELRSIYVQACPSPSSSVVIKKSSIVSGWNPEMKIGDDWYMYLNVILSKKCKAAFTLDKLWKKRVDNINVFDGRKWSEVLENLYIADLGRIIKTFKHLVTPIELKHLQQRHMYSLVELAKHNLIRDYDLIKSGRHLGRSLKIDVKYTLKSIPEVVFAGFNRKVAAVKEKKQKK